MSEPLIVLMVEDSEDDALLVLRALRQDGFNVVWERVQTADQFRAALASRPWDVVISDYRLPGFDAPAALSILQQSGVDLPFIVVSGTIGEIAAVAMMKAGAHDYLMKENLTRLPEAVRREVREAQVRAERRQAEIQLRQTAEREQLMRTVTERIRRSLDLDEILSATVTEVRQILQTDRVVLFQIDPDKQGHVVQESVALGWQALLGRDIHDPCFYENYIERYAQGRTWAIADVDDNTIQPCHAEFLRQFQVRASLIVPILQTEYLWGLLIAHHCSNPRDWKPDEIQLLKHLADQVAIAIQQADLYRQTQLELAERQRAEAALQQLNQELEQRVQERTQALQQQAEQERLLRLIVQNIHRSLDLDEILATVLSETRQTLQADRVTVYQFEADWSGRFVAESVGEDWMPLVAEGVQTVWEDTHLQETEGGRYRNGETFAVSDIYQAGHTDCHVEILAQFQVRAYAIAPIFLDEQLWGLLAIYQNTGPRDWRAWELRLLQQISLQTAIALRQSNLYQTAQAQVAELEKLHQIKDDFLSTVSHELRSPMTNIKMAIQMVEVLLEQHRIQDERLTRYLQILEEECTQELTLINDLLDLQRLEAGVQSIELENVDLNYWLPSIVEPFEARIQEQHQQLKVNLPQNLPSITTDLNGFKRILMELLHNACKYTPPHEQITLTAHVADGILHVQVSNSGIDLPAEELPRLFEKFYRVVSVDRWNRGGTGLGLALVKRLVEYLRGSIQVESANALTSFTIQLPIHHQPAPFHSTSPQ
ncbi:GAF domain-containing protein [Thermoleptolyngbya sp. M55_K2018_002]|uniref:GAF domain-containing protein n=1 Tax=Thermoleptolyngbya sp. M55_K2018_002 TaxID=2747808 RepID=UPI0019E8FB34|nr:GAF domain-containing protein [Thermoleptolyngbya sp. M55_K2018_002]HIK40652.1 GAF domain-containing protein [Thermoleptolyngbya sp. M55_K2018_002]